MFYVQFYAMSTGYVPGSIPPRFGEPYPIEATGDRGVIQVDGRLKPSRVGEIAREEAIARGYVGYRVLKGESLLRAKPVSGYWPVPYKTDTTASSAAYGM